MTVFEESVIAKTADWKFLFKIIYLYENAELTYFFLTTSKSLRQVRDPDFSFWLRVAPRVENEDP